MIWSIIILVISILIYLLIIYLAKDDEDKYLIIVGGWVKLAIIVEIAFLIVSKHPTPTALDVYRGKTTLEITYRDSVAIDSTVVYKEEMK